jgi:hypothetical protein
MTHEEKKAEAKIRGIVPGARIKCALSLCEGTVGPESGWESKYPSTIVVGVDDVGYKLFALVHDSRWATVIAPPPAIIMDRLTRFESWFNLHLGWFFTNGNKTQR